MDALRAQILVSWMMAGGMLILACVTLWFLWKGKR